MAWNVSDAKDRLSEVLDRADDESPQIITRRNREYVLLSGEDYRRLSGQARRFKDWLLKGPSLDGVDLPPRHAAAMRDVEL